MLLFFTIFRALKEIKERLEDELFQSKQQIEQMPIMRKELQRLIDENKELHVVKTQLNNSLQNSLIENI